MANFRDKRADRKEEQQCEARAQAHEKQQLGAQGREDRRHAPPPQPPYAANNRQGVYEPEFQGIKPLPSNLIETEMRSVASIKPIFEQKTREAKSGAKSFFQGIRNHAYTHKALTKLSKSLSTRSRKADSRISRA